MNDWKPYIEGTVAVVVGALVLYRIWGPEMVKDVLGSPFRRYADFGEYTCVSCGKHCCGYCENCGAPICVDCESHEFEDVMTCKDETACETRLITKM